MRVDIGRNWSVNVAGEDEHEGTRYGRIVESNVTCEGNNVVRYKADRREVERFSSGYQGNANDGLKF